MQYIFFIGCWIIVFITEDQINKNRALFFLRIIINTRTWFQLDHWNHRWLVELMFSNFFNQKITNINETKKIYLIWFSPFEWHDFDHNEVSLYFDGNKRGSLLYTKLNSTTFINSIRFYLTTSSSSFVFIGMKTVSPSSFSSSSFGTTRDKCHSPTNQQ